MSSKPNGTPFRELDQRRAFEKILVQIEDAIVEGRLQPGDPPPPERELAATFGASRASVRETLRVLESFGVVVARRGTGPNAGSIVASDAQSGLQSALRLYAGLLQIPTKDMVDVRVVLEAHAAWLAAGTGAPADRTRLREIIESMINVENTHAYPELDTAFHI